MNLLYKLLPDFLKKLFFPAIYFEPENYDFYGSSFILNDDEFSNEPCKGSLEIGNHCKGCKYEEEHT